MSVYEARFGGIARLYGAEGLERLASGHVCVIGLGGVGCWVVEALARTGIGKLTLVDMDEVCLSNVTRQLHALDDTIGRSKASLLADRIAKISPSCEVIVEECFFTESTMHRLLEPPFDFIVDAVDTTNYKCLLIAEALERNLNVITCGGAGGRTDPSRIQVADLAYTLNDPLLLQVRKRLRQQYGFPSHRKRKFKIDCVFSDELPVFPLENGSVSCKREKGASYRLNCDYGFGSATFLTGTFGFFLAAEVVRRIALGSLS